MPAACPQFSLCIPLFALVFSDIVSMRTFTVLALMLLTSILVACSLVIFEGVVDNKTSLTECVQAGDCETTFYLYVSNELGRDRWRVSESVYNSCEVGNSVERSRTDRIECELR